uniref:Bm10609 n=1 Tax=Brugia malayi TaxID=6279 RepID=A0A0J9XZW6_BRUMA|nr:Bm10609 [Brugia malayi]
MIELQGTLESAGILALLHIGYHIIEGKEVKLQNPLIVLGRDAENQGIAQTAAVIRKKVQFQCLTNACVVDLS